MSPIRFLKQSPIRQHSGLSGSRITLRRWVGPLLLVAGLLAPGLAHAGGPMRLAVDLDYAGDINEPGVEPGVGGALRFGRKLDLILVSLTPELGGSYHAFGGPSDLDTYSGFLGARLAFGKILEPGIFAHIGVGHLSAQAVSETGPTFDAGVSLDLTMLPFIDLGIHAAYDAQLIEDSDSFDWYRLGAHAALAF